MTRNEITAIAKSAKSELILGALGELQGCNAYEEYVVKDGEQGYLTKYFGIKTPFKGKISADIIDRVTLVKKAYMEITKLAFPLLPFIKKKYINALASVSRTEGGLKSRRLSIESFCPACRELLRTALKVLNPGENETDIIYSLAMFLQFSPTYRAWGQDILGELDKNNFQKHPLLETWRLKKIFMQRQLAEKKKSEFLWKLIFLAVLFNRGKAREFVKELDIEKVKLDKDDWYYVCRRSSYNFGGKELYARLVEAEQIDKKDGNTILGI